MSYYGEYPEDIINRMSFEEIQNCNWDSLFNRLHEPPAAPSNVQNQSDFTQYHFGNSQANHGIGDYHPESFGQNYVPTDTSGGHNNYWLYQRDTSYRLSDYENYNNNNCNTYYYISPQQCPHGCTIPVGNHFQNESRNGKRDIVLYRKPIFIPIGTGLKSKKKRVMVLENEDDFYRILVDDDKLFDAPNTSSSSSDDTKSDDAMTEPSEQLEDDDVTMPRQQQMRCKICRRQFRVRRLLLEHLENHQKPFCRICLSPFKNETNLRTHENKFHPNNDKTLSKMSRSSTAKDEQYGKEAVDKIVVTSKYGRRRKVLDLTSVKTTKLTRLTQPPKNHFKKLF